MIKNAALQTIIELVGVAVNRNSVYAGDIKTTFNSTGQGDPVILLHGNPSYGLFWYPVIGPLSNKFRVIAPDVVGYGESDKPSAPYDKHFYCAWLNEFMDALGLNKASIVGHSQGGAIAIHFALDYQERVEKLVIVDSGGLGPLESTGVLFNMILYVLFPSRKAALRFGRYAFHSSTGRIGREEVMEYGVEVLRLPGSRRAPLRSWKIASLITSEQLANIVQDTLLIWGEQDIFFSASQAEEAHKAIPRSQLQIIPSAGHVPFYDQREDFNNILINFLRSEPNRF